MAQSANDNRPTQHPHHHDQDGSFDQLPFAGQLLLWGIRHWVTALKTQGNFAAMTGDGFNQFGLGLAGQSLDELFQVIAVSATRQIDIRCVKCRQTSEDEVLLLDCLAAAQENRLPLAYAGLLEILPPTAVRHAMPTLISLAKIFLHAGLVLGKDKTTTVPREAKVPASSPVSTSLIDRAAMRLAEMEIPALVH